VHNWTKRIVTLLFPLLVVMLSQAICGADFPYKTGDRIILESLGDVAGPRWLDGRTIDGTVGLAPTFDGQFTGATWELVRVAGDVYSLKTLGAVEGPRWLSCRAGTGVVSLSTISMFRHPVNASGSSLAATYRWHIVPTDRDIVALRCAADDAHPAWLDGRTHTGTVGLAPFTTPPFTGARWRIHDVRPADVLTQRYNEFRTGINTAETILSPALLRANRFGKLFTRTVEGQIHAQPLYAADLTIAGARHNAIFIATAANYVYAFDADRAETPAPLWRSLQLGAPVPWTDIVPDTLIQPLVGIISTPVIDKSTLTMYVLAKSKTIETVTQNADLQDGDTVTLQTLGTIPGPSWLDAHTADGSVGLAPTYGGPALSGTWWQVRRGSGPFSLRSLGRGPSDAVWLDGRTANATVGLAPNTAPPFTGATWKIVDAGGGGVALQTQGTIPGPRFLDGRTANATVGLAPTYSAPYSGARWRLQRHVYHNTLYALDLLTGVIKRQVEISGAASGTVFDSKWQLNRPGLLLKDGIIYVAFGAHADQGPYNGWVFAYRALDLGPSGTFVTVPGRGGGIWQSGSGLTSDEAGNVYMMTGNDNSAAGAIDNANSFVKLREVAGNLSVAGTFHAGAGQPFDMNACDLDLGSSGPVHLPGTNELIGVGKQGILYTLSEDAMNTPLQQFSVAQNQYSAVVPSCKLWHDVETWPHVHGTPIAWRTAAQSLFVYVWPEQDRVKRYVFEGGRFRPGPSAASVDIAPAMSMPGGMLALSADGEKVDSGIVWGMRPSDCPPGATTVEDQRPCNAQFNVVPGVLKAFDAQTLVELWSSGGSQDSIGMLSKFSPPTVTRGKVYVGTFGAKCTLTSCPSDVIVFGVRPGL
jgi:hypothetical protein